MAGRILVVRPLQVANVDAYLDNLIEVDSGSGVNGSPHFHPYSAADAFDLETGRQREVRRWTTPITEVDWRRAWGLFDQDTMVGDLYLAGAALRSGLHRADLGIGILATHRRAGGGTLLLRTAIVWARAEPNLHWIDLDVFADNPAAHHLYQASGFEEIGRTVDRVRVDGASLDDISMTLNVAAAR